MTNKIGANKILFHKMPNKLKLVCVRRKSIFICSLRVKVYTKYVQANYTFSFDF